MEMISAIILISLAAVPLAVLAGWFVSPRHGELGSVVHGCDSDSWWRATMPWPHGVQEEDGVRWHLRDQEPAVVDPSAGGSPTGEVMAADFEIAPVRPQTRIRFLPSPSERGSLR